MLTAEQPFLDPRLFKDRNFVAGLVFIFLVGIVLLATLALLPPFLQNLMGYPVLTTGMVLAPRGIGTMLAMFLVGRLIGRVDPRLLILAGLSLTAISLWRDDRLHARGQPATIVRTGIVQGFGLGLIFVPLSTLTFATLPPRLAHRGRRPVQPDAQSRQQHRHLDRGHRLLSQFTQINHAEIAAHMNPFNAALYEPAISQHWNAWSAAGQAALNGVITEQAEVVAYAADYRMMMFLTLATFRRSCSCAARGVASLATRRMLSWRTDRPHDRAGSGKHRNFPYPCDMQGHHHRSARRNSPVLSLLSDLVHAGMPVARTTSCSGVCVRPCLASACRSRARPCNSRTCTRSTTATVSIGSWVGPRG